MFDLKIQNIHYHLNPTYVATSFSSALSDLRSGNIPGVFEKRTTYGADIVALLIDDTSFCGLANIGPGIDRMFSVTAWNCATGYYSFGHEIGHNLGLLHDRGTSSACGTVGYNFGYRDPAANFRTILAYNCVSGQCDGNAGGGCTRIKRFSTPLYTYTGQPLGTTGDDNARAINDVRVEVAGYYPHVSAPSGGNTFTSLPVGTASNAPVTFFIPFEGYAGGQPSSAIITDVETRGDFSWSGEYLELRVSTIPH